MLNHWRTQLKHNDTDLRIRYAWLLPLNENSYWNWVDAQNLLGPIEVFYESLINARALIPVNAAINAR